MATADVDLTGRLPATVTMAERQKLSFVSGVTVKSFTLKAMGFTDKIIVEMPAFGGAVVTGTLSIENMDGKEIYAEATLAEDTDYCLPPEQVPIVGKNTVKMTLSTDPLSSGDCYITVYLRS